MTEINNWGITSENILSVAFKNGDCVYYDLNNWTHGSAPMTPEEVAVVTPILLKCGWPYDQPGLQLVVTHAGAPLDLKVVAVTLNTKSGDADFEDLDDSRIKKVLWVGPKPAPAPAPAALLDEFLDRAAQAERVTNSGAPHPKNIQFTVNTYDADGDCFEKGVFLHFGNARVCVAESPQDFIDHIVPAMEKIAREVRDNYNLKTGRPK